MSTGEIVSIILAAGFLIIAASVAIATFYFIKTLKSITSLADSLQNTTENIRDRIQNRFLSLLPAILAGLVSRLLKRGRG